ncbi:MAG TPA: hypothetical protein QGG59_10695 [Planctomycetota bacterium]|jgi:hypothetical protein|nr:hypothetical protein [Planctomycetota bacterium]MDP6128125.1 hypothetical protein [Planctomycetota bacterium]MDP6850898.1 hypothetical protein [Planctomycetota bacterium]HJM40564.1 hypothetical protein [Planctomycetota bacterium]|tara:strand:- start:21735 stop:22886 length:1152 start_codon:yes stop_codon:yes gene_type:complete
MSAATRKRKPDPGSVCHELCELAARGKLPKLLLLAPPPRGEEESWFAEKILGKARERARATDGIDFLDLDGGVSDFEPGPVEAFLGSTSLFGGGQRALVFGRATRAFTRWKKLSKQILDAAKDPSGPDWMVLQLDGAAGSKLATAMSKDVGEEFRLERFRRLYGDPPPWRPNDLDASEAAQFVASQAKLLGIRLLPGASGTLVQIAGARPAELCQALEHFALLDSDSISEEQVRETVAHSAEGSAFEFAEAVLTGNGASAFAILSRLRSRGLRSWDGKRIASQDAFSMLLSVLAGERRRTAAALAAMEEGMSFPEACKEAGLPATGPIAKRMERRIRSTSSSRLTEVLHSIRAAECHVKREGRRDNLKSLEQLAFHNHRSRRA